MADPIVFLPGLMCDARLFAPQVAALSSETSVTVAPLTKGERIEEIASHVLSQMPARFALAGLSMGGIVAMEMLRRAPERITRLALLDTNPLSETPEVASAREPQIVRAKAGRMEEVIRDEMKPNYLAPGPGRADVMALVMDMARDLGPEVFVRQSRALQRRKDQQATLSRCKVPTLILCGAHDKLCPVRRHKFMAELIEGAKLVVLDDAGHLPTLEQPWQTTHALREWMGLPYKLD